MNAMTQAKTNIRKTRDWLVKEADRSEDVEWLEVVAHQLSELGDLIAAAKFSNKASAIRMQSMVKEDE
jgi:hypothetical protein